MRLNDLRIGTKMVGSFVLVILIFGAIAGFQIIKMNELGTLQDEGASRADDNVEIKAIELGVVDLYTVIADGIINRDVEATRAGLEFEKNEAESAIASVRELVDTDAEQALVDDFVENYGAYLDLFENQLLPILERGEDETQRARDTIEILEIAIRLPEP